ncbi:hypothetical protein KIL84_021101, partial [Mauremys mutica]
MVGALPSSPLYSGCGAAAIASWTDSRGARWDCPGKEGMGPAQRGRGTVPRLLHQSQPWLGEISDGALAH